MEPITSTQNPKVKLVNNLLSRARARHKAGQVVLEGVRLIRDAWQNHHVPEFILYTPDSDASLLADLEAGVVQMLPVDDTVMRHVTDTHSPQGIVGVFPMPRPAFPPGAGRVLILDALRDPGNLGTILRAAGGAGVDAVVLAPGSVDPYNPKVLRAGMGAHFRVPVIEMDWHDIAESVRTTNVYLAAADAPLRYDAADWTERWALIIGSEAHGVGDEALRFATEAIAIPMARETESINAAMAAAVILFEAARHRV